MNNKFLFTLALILVVLSYIFSIDKDISKNLSILTTNIRVIYIDNMTIIQNSIFKYFDQVAQIEHLQKVVLANEQYKSLYSTNQHNNKHKIKQSMQLDKIQVVSYINFNDFSKVLLKSDKKIENISALITTNGYSAGIAHIHNNQIIGYLNHHKKSNYSVYIGDNLVPGITHGNKNKETINIKFIPKWQNINIGDEVITSGMDNIFQKGVKVGKVVNVKELTNTKEAVVKPYANTHNKNYFYLYTTKINKDSNISN